MEAASAAHPLARLRTDAYERECEKLRPLGIAFVLRRFGGSLGRADAEDAVAEVLIRLHRMSAAGRPPRNLRATFFASVRNQAIDQLRSRAARPTVGLEAASEAVAPGVAPAEWAESREDAARLQEALGRMRGNYREAILLRFGLGMTVPEIATHLQISLPAAKKLVLRATAQARKRLASIEEAEFCPEMRQVAKRSVLEKHLSGLASDEEAKVMRAHFAHCGSCKSFLASLHDRVHELGSAAVFGLGADDRLGAHLGLLDHLGRWAGAAVDHLQTGGGRLRHLAYKAGGALSGSDAPAGALIGTGQKIAAICTAGAATTATCLLTGAVGPGLGASAPPVEARPQPAAQVREVSEPTVAPRPEPSATPETPEPAPQSTAEPASPPAPPTEAASEPTAPAPAASVPRSEPTPAPTEFGVESSPPASPAPSEVVSPVSAPRSVGGSGAGEFGSAGSAESTPSSEPGSGAGVGFHG